MSPSSSVSHRNVTWLGELPLHTNPHTLFWLKAVMRASLRALYISFTVVSTSYFLFQTPIAGMERTQAIASITITTANSVRVRPLLSITVQSNG